MDFLTFSSPVGDLALASEDGITLSRLYLPSDPLPRIMPHETPLLAEGRRQILEYLSGSRRQFDLPLAPKGTAFQRRVWSALTAIPFGQTRSYKDIAMAVGCPGGFRAVGMANHANPIPIIIPCHRVIAADGSLGGYGGGIALKKALLALEGQYF
ncbi:MAG: methylated-DNA--[protein]-cysteine S-methyltransferase [Oscillospiraceae bacterium]|nr:methylated-DNA--[protein]-cysteine S-methyltransferase [Oscillospiraceae bacterium]